MAIDYRSLFSSNFFTREQVDILIALSGMIIAEGGGGGEVSDNTKADKVTIMTAGTGLIGGGNLSANRTFELDLPYLDARYPLLVDGKINISVLPPLPVHDTFVVADQAAMLALDPGDVDNGDYAVRQDNAKTYVLGGDGDPSVLANWTELPAASGASSFNGRTGAILPEPNDYDFDMLANIPNTIAGHNLTGVVEPVIAAADPAPTTKYWRGDKTWQVLNKASVGLPNVDDTSDNAKPLGTAQLATLAADTGLSLVHSKGPGTGAINRDVDVQLYERAISLRNYALADGSDETTKVQNWLNAIASQKRKGYVPEGTYRVNGAVITADYIDVECHPEAKFIGIVTDTLGSELCPAANSGTWTLGSLITQDAGGIHWSGAADLASATVAVAGLEDNTEYEVSITLGNYVGGSARLIAYGDTTAHAAVGTSRSANGTYTQRITTNAAGSSTDLVRLQATGATGSNTFSITAVSVKKVISTASGSVITCNSSTGTSTARAGRVKWMGGQFDSSALNYVTEGNACGLVMNNYARAIVRDVSFVGGTDFEAAELAGKSGSGVRLSCCDRANIESNEFIGYVEAGVFVTGGTTTGSNDDGVGTHIAKNHFIKCKYGARATRAHRSLSVIDNEFDQCYVPVYAHESSTNLRAAQLNVCHNHMRRPGKAGVHVRHQLGFIIADNRIVDLGYKLDGTTTVTGTLVSAIITEGCAGGEIHGNVIRKDELLVRTGNYGISNLHYLFNAVTEQPSDIFVHDNHIADLEFGLSEAGATGSNNRYRGNDMRSVTTLFDDIPNEFLPYGIYTPTITNTTNVTASTPAPSMWRRDELDITCNISVSIDPTTASTPSEIQITLPIDPGFDFANDYEIIGVAYNETHNVGGRVLAATDTSRRARLLFTPGSNVTNQVWHITLMFRLEAVADAEPPPEVGEDLALETAELITDSFGEQIQI